MTTSYSKEPPKVLIRQPWLCLIYDESDPDYAPERTRLADLFKELLSSESPTAVREAAVKMDVWGDRKDLLKSDWETEEYLGLLDECVTDLIEIIPYNDARQDMLVSLLLELRNLRRSCLADDDKFIRWTGYPGWDESLEERWRGYFVARRSKSETPEYHQLLCNRWINYCSFEARCLAAGIEVEVDDHAAKELREGLEKEHPEQPTRDTKVLVAAQYVLIGGQSLHQKLVAEPRTGENERTAEWSRKTWPLWAARFKEIKEKGDCSPEVLAAAGEAHEKMVKLGL
ncbi:hypothetical protein F4780DRAFT_688374 [Xylariomycetidae sp. FL0641]|nr:hypothetical protein F4780DRAFT_688374 [Xylariomycetidae sp. FL0641]